MEDASHGTPSVFPTHVGKSRSDSARTASPTSFPYICRDVPNRRIRKVLERLDLPDISFHSFRHTHATLMLQAGVHPKVVSERLGHSSIEITMDRYSHVLPTIQRGGVKKFAKQTRV